VVYQHYIQGNTLTTN